MTEKNSDMRLLDAAQGSRVIITQIDAGAGLKRHLASLGILVNAELAVHRNTAAGPFIVEVKASKIILGRGMAAKIKVKLISQNKDAETS